MKDQYNTIHTVWYFSDSYVVIKCKKNNENVSKAIETL